MKALRILLLFILFTLNYSISAQTVYTTKTGKKYHKSNCRYLKYSKKEIKLEKAKALGYQACKVCKHIIASNTKSNSLTTKKEKTTTPSKKATTTQCTGKTKVGKRCKRKTKSANGRCYQH